MQVARSLVLLLAAASALTPADKKAESGSQSVNVVSLSIRRLTDQPVIAIEGKISNPGPHAIHHLTLIFDVLGTDGQVVSRQRGPIDEDPFEPGDTSDFQWQMRDEARAVEIRFRGVARFENVVKVDKPGPYAIE